MKFSEKLNYKIFRLERFQCTQGEIGNLAADLNFFNGNINLTTAIAE